MKEKNFNDNVENIYNTLTDKQKNEYKSKEDKMNKGFAIAGIVLLLFILATLVGGIVFYVKTNDYSLLLGGIIFLIIGTLLAQWIFRCSLKELKSSDEIKIKKYIERLENQKELKREQEEKKLQQELQKNVHYRLSTEQIARVTILDSYTELSDKLHAIVGYQEIIQTRVYKFKVDYKDNTSKIITAPENSEEYIVLMSRVNSNTENPAPQVEKSNVEKLREYKQLLDDGIITREEFEAKKKELL